MTEFTKKSAGIESLMGNISEAMGGSGMRTPGKCMTCPRGFDVATEFRNAISQKEYKISGMCQQCQDSVFGAD